MRGLIADLNAYAWLAALVLTGFASQGLGAAEPNLDEGVAIKGYDPVSYFQQEPQEGKLELNKHHNGVEYHFANEKNREAFAANPEQYLPQYGGWCAYAMLDGDKVEVDPRRYKIIGGKLYLFYDGFWGNTLKKWNDKAREQSDEALVAKADAQWRTLSE